MRRNAESTLTSKSVDWSEFLKNASGKESADRLLLLLSFPPATWLALSIGTTESLGVYLAAYGALAANNKWVDRNANSGEVLETSSDSTTTSERVVSRSSDSKQSVPPKPAKRKNRGF